jgi:hypothetical protein
MGHINLILDMDSMESIQAVLACAVYSIRSPVGASIWSKLSRSRASYPLLTVDRKLSGMAIRHCIELGYHRNAKRLRLHTNALTHEMSKRAFWVAYDIDRAAAFALGRPFGISDLMIDVEVSDPRHGFQGFLLLRSFHSILMMRPSPTKELLVPFVKTQMNLLHR